MQSDSSVELDEILSTNLLSTNLSIQKQRSTIRAQSKPQNIVVTLRMQTAYEIYQKMGKRTSGAKIIVVDEMLLQEFYQH